MKVESLPGLLVAASAHWVACCYAYAAGTFRPYGFGNLGFIPIDEVLASSAGVVAVTQIILMPLLICVVIWARQWTTYFSEEWRERPINVWPTVGSMVLIFFILNFYRQIVEPFQSAEGCIFLALIALLLGLSVIVTWPIYTRLGFPIGMAAAVFLSSTTVLFLKGESNYFSPSAFAGISKQSKLVGCGRVIFQSRSGVFIRGPWPGAMSYLKSDSYDRIDRWPCDRTAMERASGSSTSPKIPVIPAVGPKGRRAGTQEGKSAVRQAASGSQFTPSWVPGLRFAPPGMTEVTD